jgi:hypothetical protein
MGMRNSSGVATYTTSDLAPGTHLITAFYGGDPNNLASTSGALSQTIAGNAPVPVLTSLSPSSIYAGGSAFTMTVNGSSFVSTSTVLWNGGSRTTTFISSTVLQAAVTAADIAAEGTATVTVSTPAPGGGVSNGLAFDIVPAITSTTLSSTPSPSAYGQMVRFTAAFTSFWCGGGSGTIALIDGTNTLSTGMVFANGIVSFDIGTLSAGTHQITARYSGSTSCAPSASSLTQNVTGIKVTASVTAANKSYDGTNTAIITGCKLIGVLPVDRGNGRERSGGNRFFGLHPQR